MERRSGKEQRQHIERRYQSAAYPEFVDTRKGGDRRKVSYQDLPGHPTRKFIILIGVVAVLLIYLFLVASFVLTKKSAHETVRKKTITLGCYQDHPRNHTRVTGA